MIRYTLTCADDHRFESWFASAEAFDRLERSGQLSCAVCGSGEVTKSLMAPQVRPTDKAVAERARLEANLAALRDKVERESTYVGPAFASEARAMHLGEVPQKPIHGEAKLEDARALIEDGVPVMPLPFRPKAKLN